MKLVPLTVHHIQMLAGLPEKDFENLSIVGTACVSDDGWPVAIWGAYLLGRKAEAFAYISTVAKIYPVSTGRIAKDFLSKLPEIGVEVVIAYPDPIPNAERFMEWLGFVPTGIVNERGRQYEKWV